jgi:alpha-N-acetylglucosaminidase
MLKILPGNGGGGNGGHFALTSIPPAWNAPQGPLPPKTAPAGVVHGRPPEAIRGLVAALDALFQADPKSREADGYRYDAVNFMRQALAYYGDDVRARILDARKRNDPEDLARQARIMLGILRDMDELTGTRHEFLMGRWIRDARAWGATPAEADYYEANARRIVTAWGAGLRDYARREWNGLLRDYYLPRWWFWAQKYAPDAVKGETAPGPKDDFTAAKNAGYAVEPSGDPVGTAQRLFQKYRAEMIR